MRIQVKNRQYGFFSTDPITVYRMDDSGIVWCNHDGYIEENLPQQIIHSDDSVTEWEEPAEVCDKCHAYRWRGEEEWRDEV